MVIRDGGGELCEHTGWLFTVDMFIIHTGI